MCKHAIYIYCRVRVLLLENFIREHDEDIRLYMYGDDRESSTVHDFNGEETKVMSTASNVTGLYNHTNYLGSN